MNVGRSAPRYQIMALLYPQSKSLQSHLSEYFIVIVRLCHQLLKFTQKSAFWQVTSTLSDLDIKAFQSELDLWANFIKEEVSLLMAKKIEEEAQENSRFRALSRKLSKSVSLQQELATNLRVLDFCSKYDHETTWKQIRKVGNATIFSQAAEYQEWKGRSDSCTLIYTGKLGSGKSVSLANIVDDIHLDVQGKDIAVAYFFCRHDIPESLKAQTVIGSLARQLLRPILNLAIVAELLNKTTSAWDFEILLSLFRRALPPSYRAYFILDGLDECDSTEKKNLIQHLGKLQELFTLSLCVSHRIEPDNTSILSSEQFTTIRITSIPDENPDIKVFINAELESCIKSQKLVIGNPNLILEIRDALLKGSQGMFLWVALQIESLCAMRTDTAIRGALADLPKDLPETFSRILQRSEESGKPYQRPILELVTIAHRPLTVEELREALGVVPGDAIWNPARLLNDVYSTLSCCGCLLTVDEEELTVRLVHHSVKQFLLNGFAASTNISFTLNSAQRKMADIIVTYLSYGIFETQLSTQVAPQMMTGLVPSGIIHSTLDSSSTIRNLALKLLKSRKCPEHDISRTLVEMSKSLSSRSINKFHFYSYAKSYWLQHIFYVSRQEPVIYDLLLRLFEGNVLNTNPTAEDDWMPLIWALQNGNEIVKLLLDSGKIDANSKDTRGQTPLSWAAENGHEAVVKLLLETGKVDVDSKDTWGRTPLWRAAENGHEVIVKLLLETGKVDVSSKDTWGRTPLWSAAGNEHEAIVKLLLETGKVDVGSKDTRGRTPLSWAAENGHEAVVKLLLETGKVDVGSKDTRGRTPLWSAAENKHEAIVKLLLETGKVDVGSKGTWGRTPLSWAAENGHEAIVKLLLETGKVDVGSKGTWGRTPLWSAAENGHEAIVKLLLETGKVDVSSKDTWGQTLLSWAAENGHEAIVKLLLETGKVDVNSNDIRGLTPLLWAVENGHEAIVKLLLETGKVDVGSKDISGWTPLLWAAENGHEAVVKLLLETGKVDVDLKDTRGRTPLWRAAENGHEVIVKLLLETGKVNVDLKDTWGQTPLLWAAGNGHEAVVKLLLKTGKVDVDLKDTSGRTPLWRAAENGHEVIVKLLLETGKVNINSTNTVRQTPLLWAAGNGHEGIVKLLLETGKVDVGLKDIDGRTPLLWAAENGHEAVVKLLLETGKVDVDLKDTRGQTPLLWAAGNGHEGIVKLLLKTGKVDVGSKDINGRTPLSWAAENGHEAIVKLLETGKVDVDSKDNSQRTPRAWRKLY
jgi:ankyrin repeat protein